jgi:multidrug efflux pump subunit AcrA (membrane-fusion protein)
MKKVFIVLLLFIFFMACNSADKKKEVADQKAKLEESNHRVVGVGMIVPEKDIVQLSSPVNGIVTKILKKENDSVSIGTVILELNHQLEDAKVKQLTNEVATQTAQIKGDEASVDEYRAKYENAVSELQRMQRLLAKGAETQQAVDDANTNLKSFQSNFKRLQAIVDVSKGRLNETKSALNIAQIERDQKIILSPVNGRILDLTVLNGGSVDIRQSFAQISPEGKTIAICEIDEMYAGKIAVGQKGWIRNVGSNDTLSTGTVYFTYSFLKKKSLFTDQSGEKEDRRVRTIKMILDKPEKLLLNARIECVIDITGSLKK